MWEVPLLPTMGPLLGYNLSLFTEDDSLLYMQTIDNENITSYTIDDLEPDTEYQVLVVAYNMYGLGNETALFSIRTAAPVGECHVDLVLLTYVQCIGVVCFHL